MTAQPLFDDTKPLPTRPGLDPERCGTLTQYRYGCRCHPCKHAKRRYNQGERNCKTCGETFHLGDPGAFVKYCSEQCQSIGYKPIHQRTQHCARCGTEHNPGNYIRRRDWNLCPACMDKLAEHHATDALAKHHANAATVIAFINDPHCQTCRTELGTYRVKNNAGQWRVNLAIDHDHTCCERSYSCGSCIRGWLCANCNHALGQVRDNPQLLRALADYLERPRP